MRKIYLLTILLLFCIVNSFSQFSPYLQLLPYQAPSGTIKEIEFKDNKVTVIYNSNFDGSLCNGCNIACYGLYTNIAEYVTTGAIRKESNYNSFLKSSYKNDGYYHTRGFPYQDSLWDPYICITIDSVEDCHFEAGLPKISSSNISDTNYVYYVGYVGGLEGSCYNLPAYKLRYSKYNTKKLYGVNYPDSLLQYYDIESYNPLDSRAFRGFSTSILPTKDEQQLIAYISPDTTRDNSNIISKTSGFHLLKLDASLNRTYATDLFPSYFSDSTYLNISISKQKVINNKIFIGGNAEYIINNTNTSFFQFILECDSNGILLNEILTTNFNALDSVFNTSQPSTTFIKTKNKDSLFITKVMNEYGNYDAYISIYDSTSRLKKHELLYKFIANEITTQNDFYVLDSFNNLFYFFHEADYQCGLACGSLFQTIGMRIINLESINHIDGTVSYDKNNNCIKDTLETSLKNILVELQMHGRSLYTMTDDLGEYRFTPYDTGHAKVIVHIDNQLFFTNICTDTIDVILSDTMLNPKADFLLQASNCALPKVSVNINTPFLRRCFDNIYTLSIKNETSDTITNAYVDITLDDGLTPIDTSFAHADLIGNHKYRFYFTNLPPLQTIRKNLLVNVNCTTTIEAETHCVTAEAFPYNLCLTTDLLRLNVTTNCRNDSVVFTITKVNFPNSYSPFYRIIANDTTIQQGYLNFINNTIELAYNNPDGKTLRFESYQIPAYPNEDTIVSAAIEGCGNTPFSTGYITLFEQDDDVPFIDIDCQQNVSSFDPNEKLAQPGNGDSAVILPNSTIEYTIHFQNKGTFMASYVYITDTISPLLDISTFQFIASSHEFSYKIIDSNILEFASLNVDLPAEQDDTLGSMGFITFSIKPKKNLAENTAIENTANIVFDFNNPITTNTVTRSLHDFIQLSIISSVRNDKKSINTTIYPNPFKESTTIQFNYNKSTTLSIYAINGKIVQQYSSNDNSYIINRNSLPAGMYLYELRDKTNNSLIDTGKIIAQ